MSSQFQKAIEYCPSPKAQDIQGETTRVRSFLRQKLNSNQTNT